MKIRRTNEPPKFDELTEAVRAARDAKQALQSAEELNKKAQHVLAELMISRQLKTAVADIDGKEVVATVVQTEREVINEEGLRSALGSNFDKIAVLKIDKVLLKKAITEGGIDMNAVAKNVQIVPSAPYIRFSARGATS
jgi:hypothetical protein